MSTKNKGYLLPDLINPANERGYCVPVPNDPAYIRAFFGQMSELGRWGIWAKDDSHKAVDAATRWRDSYSRISDCSGEPCEECPDECEGDCGVIFTPDDPHIDFAPNDPYRTPDHVPAGYLLPPWGLDDGRPSVGLDSLPLGIFNPIAILSGFPRFKIHCKGDGSALLYLRKVGNGGYAYITVDGNPAGKLVDMASWSIVDFDSWSDLLAPIIGEITGSGNPVEIVEVDLEGSGDHYIDVTALPKLGGLFVLTGFGLQLEKVKICTDEAQEVIEEVPPQIQLVDCILQWRPNSDADWVDLGNVCGEDGEDGIDGEDGTCPDICENNLDTPSNIDWYCRSAKVFAEQIYQQAIAEIARVNAELDPIGLYSQPFEYMLPLSTLNDPYFVEGQGDWGSVDADGWEAWDDVTGNETYETIMLEALRSRLECLYKDEAHNVGDYTEDEGDPDLTLSNYLNLAGFALFSAHPHTSLELTNAAEKIADGLFYWYRPYAAAHFDNMINAINYEANLSPAFGTVACLVEDCDPPETFAHTFDFAIDDGGWVSADSSFYDVNTWVETSGWRTGLKSGNVLLGIKKTFATRYITRFRVEYTCGAAASSGGRLHKLNPSDTEYNLNTGSGTFVSDQTPNVDSNDLRIFLDSVGTTVHNYIRKVIVEGLGTDPF